MTKFFLKFFCWENRNFDYRTDQKSKVYDLLRLLMQYHDPELCTYLESLRVKPHQYVSSWFRTLLAKDTDLSLCLAVWDHYFEKVKFFLNFWDLEWGLSF